MWVLAVMICSGLEYNTCTMGIYHEGFQSKKDCELQYEKDKDTFIYKNIYTCVEVKQEV